MKIIRFKFIYRFFNLLLILLLLIGSLSIPNGMVVCYGADGHIAIEMGENDCNDTPQQVDNSQEHSHQLAEKHCGDCTDIPLILQSSEMTTPEPANLSHNIQPVFLAASWEILPNTFLETMTEGQLPQPPPLIDLFLKAHRTVVLLI